MWLNKTLRVYKEEAEIEADCRVKEVVSSFLRVKSYVHAVA
jgi:hypothetical protein